MTGDSGGAAAGALSIRGVRKRFGGFTALHDVGLEIPAGQFVSFLGPSGCGKTTLLRLIGGFLQPDGGSILLDGRDLAGLPPNRRDVGMVFQNLALFPHLTVGENVGFGLSLRGRPGREIADAVAGALRLVELPGMERRRIQQLSGGQRQRVALARALVLRPRVLLLDEPLSALDLKLRRQLQVELKGLQRRSGTTFVFVTHDQEEALSMSDRVAVFRDGRVEQFDTPAAVYDRPRTRFVAGFVGDANLVPPAALHAFGLALPGNDLVLVRPEHCRIGAAAGPSAVLARVAEMEFVGPHARLRLALPGLDAAWLALCPGRDAAGLAPGQEVRVAVDPAALARVPAGDGA